MIKYVKHWISTWYKMTAKWSDCAERVKQKLENKQLSNLNWLYSWFQETLYPNKNIEDNVV